MENVTVTLKADSVIRTAVNHSLFELPQQWILTACLLCGWVHEFPGRCPRFREAWRKLSSNFTVVPPSIPREGIYALNDWSTVFNGTNVHRYVGEQKFAFVLFNVTGTSANFTTGMNAILVPRGVYFDTAFHKLLNSTWTEASSSPLAGATIIGNDASSTRGLNARVAQLLVSHNVTASQAETLLTKLLTNASGGKIATILDVTDEYYTMGFVNEVGDIVPNTAVTNTGNFSPPSPPPPPQDTSFWGSFWNALAGAVQFLWNAVVAAAVFICNVIAAVVQFALSVVTELTSAAYAAVKAIAKAVVDAILAVIKFIVDLVKAAFQVIWDGLIAGAMTLVGGWIATIATSLERMEDALAAGQPASSAAFATALLGGPWIAFAAIAVALAILATLFLPFAFLLVVITAAILIIALAAFGMNPPSGDLPDMGGTPLDARAIFLMVLGLTRGVSEERPFSAPTLPSTRGSKLMSPHLGPGDKAMLVLALDGFAWVFSILAMSTQGQGIAILGFSIGLAGFLIALVAISSSIGRPDTTERINTIEAALSVLGILESGIGAAIAASELEYPLAAVGGVGVAFSVAALLVSIYG